MLQARMALMPQDGLMFAPTQNCYGEGCSGGSQPAFIRQKPFHETPYFIGGGLFTIFILIFVGFLILRNRKNKK